MMSLPLQRAIPIVLVATMALLSVSVHSFVNHPSASCLVAVYPKSDSRAAIYRRENAFQVASSISTSDGENNQEDPSFNRRSLFFAGASATAGYFLKETMIPNRIPATATLTTTIESGGTSVPTTTTVTSVEEALAYIESMGDKRFLHAVVASDYQFLYEQQQSTLSSMNIDVQQIFSKKVPSAKTGSRSVVLGATGSLTSRKAPSLWPLGTAVCSTADISCTDIHYAWPELGGVLQSTTVTQQQIMIVDGIDCGKMSLEDALEGDMQVLVQAPTYLSVPNSMESDLRKGLRGAFLI